MKILVVGSGGREHALCWKIAQSPLCQTLYCAPGNAGTQQVAQNVTLAADDVDGLVAFVRDTGIDFVVVGPEVALVAGLVDALRAINIPAFGPVRAAAQLEGSKAFTKNICRAYNIPTASFAEFDDVDAATKYLHGQPEGKIVVKADGLAAGKGVIIANSTAEAIAAVRDMLAGNTLGTAGHRVVIEECLEGEEVSFFCLTDGTHALPLSTAQDHKRAYDGDTGPNTGGMGAYSPASAAVFTPAHEHEVMTRIIQPTLQAMRDRGTPYTGVLYAGLMMTAQGAKLIEYNARFGDPECQVLMPRLAGDVVPLLRATADGTLNQQAVAWNNTVALTVVMAAKGYPATVQKGSEIKNLGAIAPHEALVFHAGTRDDNGRVLAHGGRVLNITGLGATTREAQRKAYAAVDKIDWPDGFCRRDIGGRAVAREINAA